MKSASCVNLFLLFPVQHRRDALEHWLYLKEYIFFSQCLFSPLIFIELNLSQSYQVQDILGFFPFSSDFATVHMFALNKMILDNVEILFIFLKTIGVTAYLCLSVCSLSFASLEDGSFQKRGSSQRSSWWFWLT